MNWPALCLVSALFLLPFLGSYGLLETSEARYAEISREMEQSGDWITPRYNFIKHFHKPPLIYWAAAASMKIFGDTEFAARLPQALFGLGGVLVTFFIGNTLFDKQTGFLAGLVLLSTLEYFSLARYLVTDMLLTFWITLSMLCYCRGLREKRNWILFFLSMAGAMMTKGPVGVLLPVMVIALDCILGGRGGEFLDIGWGKGLLITAAVSAPWYILVCLKNPGLLHYFIFFQTVERFFSTVHGRGGAFFYFIPVFLTGFLPWTPLLPALIRKYWSFRADAGLKAGPLPVLWLTAPLVFFSFSGSKLVHYILPVFPASALLTGKMWRDSLRAPEKDAASLRVSCYLYLAGFVLLAVFFLFFLADTDHVSAWVRFDLSPLKNSVPALIFLSGGGIIVTLRALKTRSLSLLFPALTLGSLLGYLTVFSSLASIEPVLSPTLLFVKKISARFRPGDKIIAYKCLLNGLAFYTGERIITFHHRRETLFEKDRERLKKYVIEDKKKLRHQFETERTVFLVIKKRHFQEALRMAGRPLFTLARNNSFMLLANRR